MKGKKKKASAALGAAAALCVAIGSLAVYTDRFQSQAVYEAGSLELALTESWEADNTALADVYKPGTAMKLDYTLVNDGNLAATVRENFVISTDKALSAGENREFDLYAAADITVDAEGNVTKITGKPLTPVYGSYTAGSDKHYTLSYALDELVLNGTGKSAESVSGGLDSYDGSYFLVFNTDVGNEYQKVNVGIEYMAQALQHGNTGNDTWTDAKVISEKVNFGGQTVDVVPELSVQGGAR